MKTFLQAPLRALAVLLDLASYVPVCAAVVLLGVAAALQTIGARIERSLAR